MAKKMKNVEYKGSRYSSVVNKGKVIVYLERTAHGQKTLLDIYDAKSKKWEHNNIPEAIRRNFESQAPTKIDKDSEKPQKHYVLGR